MDIKKKAGTIKEMITGNATAFGKYKKVIILLLAGAFLIIAGNLIFNMTGADNTGDNLNSQTAEPQNGKTVKEGEVIEPEEYAAYLQEKIEELLSTIEGVGKVKALVYVEESCEVVPAYDSEKSSSSLEENDSEGGKRKQEDISDKENLADNDGTVVLKVLYPKIKGICVSAQGAKSNVVKEKIKNALMALYGVEAHRIEILSMKN